MSVQAAGDPFIISSSLLSILGLISFSLGMYYDHYLLPDSLIDVYRAFSFLFKGREMIRNATKIYGETPFSLPMPRTRIHVFSSKEHFMEMNKSHTADLSLHVAIKEILSPQHTLGGFQIPDRRDIEGMNFVRARRSANVRIVLYIPKFFHLVEEDFGKAFENGLVNDGFVEISLSNHLRNLVVRANTLFILSEEAAHDPKFHKMAMGYAYRALLAAEICRSVPTWSKGTVSYLVQGNQRHRKYCFKEIGKYAEKYLAEGNANDGKIDLNGRNVGPTMLSLLRRTANLN
ncbi:hypothetical protein K458DRAFT_395312 [Lentithecium fluviatile CBS 122367]|uniref:Uncharacterized protein n=1 Tax=Lentithecium fluviatile CBS 122367 TaxID=1168545 RepID=A0A6G1IJ49_9PLEO|nr:hypothetical protein K458DRAFT_395312 [Lentithecium fluviatile CBS 122367]